MTVRQVIRYSALVPVAFAVFVLVTMSKIELDHVGAVAIIVFGFIVWLGGLAIGVIISAIVKKPYREHWFYLAGQIVVILTVANLMINGIAEPHNIRSNHSLVNLDNELYPGNPYLHKAFLKLESSFKDPNSFRIIRFRTYTRDSVFVADFTYTMDEKTFLSRVIVLHDTAKIKIFNGEPGTEEEYSPVTEDINKGKALFNQHCASCHNVHKEVVGPPLGETVENRSNEWIFQFLTKRSTVTKDSLTLGLVKKYGLECHKFPELTKEETDLIIEYAKKKRQVVPQVSIID